MLDQFGQNLADRFRMPDEVVPDDGADLVRMGSQIVPHDRLGRGAAVLRQHGSRRERCGGEDRGAKVDHESHRLSS